jgi:hypothetical protein
MVKFYVLIKMPYINLLYTGAFLVVATLLFPQPMVEHVAV